MFNLRKMTSKDIFLFERWLATPHVAKWYQEPKEWLREVREQNGEFNWIHHYILELDKIPVGFCQYYAVKFSDEEWLKDIELNGTYSIDYFIGEVDALRHGLAKQMISLLTKEILKHNDAKRIIVKPEKENVASCSLLISCGFLMMINGIYVKKIG